LSASHELAETQHNSSNTLHDDDSNPTNKFWQNMISNCQHITETIKLNRLAAFYFSKIHTQCLPIQFQQIDHLHRAVSNCPQIEEMLPLNSIMVFCFVAVSIFS
jgi:hypothetical protein